MSAESNFALVSVNGKRWTIHKTGVAIHVPLDRRSVLRVCVAGDVVSRCFGAKLDNLKSTHTSQCELLTDDCTCYRWLFSRDLTNTPTQIKTSASRRRPMCAVVTYTPRQTSANAVLQRLTSVNLIFELDHFRPVVPHGYVWHMMKGYQKSLETTKMTPANQQFFQYFHKHKNAYCDKRSRQSQAIPVAYNCRRQHLLPLYATNFEKARNASPAFVEPLLFGIHIILFTSMWARAKNKLKNK